MSAPDSPERPYRVEEVDAVPPPPKARVDLGALDPGQSGDSPGADVPGGDASDGGGETARATFERKRDYLDGFLAHKPAPEAAGAGGTLQAAIVEALKDIYDPEIPVNIYDLGLIYDVAVTDDGHATVTMTLTTPHCPVAESMPAEVELRVAAVPGVGVVDVVLVWDPPWDPQKMSDEARLELGML